MHLSLYDWVFSFLNIFWTYTVYLYMKVFYDVKRTKPTVELLTYVAYNLFILIIYFFANIPIVFILGNIAALFLLSYNYESTVKKRILSTALTYLSLMIIELIAISLSGYINFYLFSKNNYSFVYGLIVSRILTFLVAIILNNFKNIKKGESVPNSHWFCIVLVPVTSLYMNVLIFQTEGLTVVQVLIGIILLFSINFATFYLYDAITAALTEKMQSLLIIEQNKYYDRQFELMKASLQTTKAIKHDLKNHMFSIRSLVENGDKKEALGYISDILASIGAGQDYATSGNTIIDSIINFKFQEAEQSGIKTALDLKIPVDLEIPSYDMTIILGNLLDNAIKAVSSVKEEPFISLKIKYDKGRLLIQAINPYSGQIRRQNGTLLTTKEDKENHGIGLTNIKNVIQKYDGTMSMDYKTNIFSISILMYVDC